MADKTKIEWSDATWNPITGCLICSTGCANCYAMKLAAGRLRHHHSRAGLTTARGKWNGEVRFNQDWLYQPMHWQRPRRIFVCAHSDLFYEKVPDEWIDRIFAVMALCPQHVFQVLTKRPYRMMAYCRLKSTPERVSKAVSQIARGEYAFLDNHLRADFMPLPNVWLGTSVENQEAANHRLHGLVDTPAAVRWISAEPLLEDTVLFSCDGPLDIYPGQAKSPIDWVVVGGESGPGHRPMNPNWARSIQAQCIHHGVRFFMKQMAGKLPIPPDLMVRQWP